MTEKPQWRKSYDAVERAWRRGRGAGAQRAVRARSPLRSSVSGARVGNGVNGVAARVWHLVNLPAGTDIQRLRKQIGALDRDVRRLSLQLEQRQDQPREE